MRTRKIAALCLALCLLMTVAACRKHPRVETTEEELVLGEGYRDFTAALADGGTFCLSDHLGKTVLVNFWATWCKPCVGEMPAFTRLAEAYGDDLVLLAVNRMEDEETVRNFLEENGYAFPVALDPEGEISALYPSTGIPYTVIFAPDGTVAETQLGANNADEMFAYYCEVLDRILASP